MNLIKAAYRPDVILDLASSSTGPCEQAKPSAPLESPLKEACYMRRPIDTAPRSGDDIWVEDATGAVEVGHWSPEAGKWVWQDGSLIDPAPTHWYLVAEDVDPEDEKSGGSLVVAAILIPVVFVAASLFGVFTPFTAQQTMTHIGSESALSLDGKPDITAGSPALRFSAKRAEP